MRKSQVGLAGEPLVDLVNAPGRPGMHGRVHVAERPIRRPASCPLGCMYHSRRIRMSWRLAKSGSIRAIGTVWKGQVPGGEPGVFPLVGHGEHVGGVQVHPVRVAAVQPLGRRRRPGRVADQPLVHVVAVVLLGPHQAGKGLPHHVALVVRQPLRLHGGEELVGFGLALVEELIETLKRLGGAAPRQPHPDDRCLARRQRHGVVSGGLGALPGVAQPVLGAVDQRVVEAVFDAGPRRWAGPTAAPCCSRFR